MNASFLSIAALTTLVACSTLSVSSQYDKAASMPEGPSFDWGKTRDGTEGTDQAIRKAIQSELEKRGYRHVSPGEEADFIVTYDTDVEQKVASNDLQFGFTGTSDSVVQYGSGPVTFPYREGSTRIQLVDSKKQQVVWEAVGKRIVDRPQQNEAQVSDSIRGMFERFPGSLAR